MSIYEYFELELDIYPFFSVHSLSPPSLLLFLVIRNLYRGIITYFLIPTILYLWISFAIIHTSVYIENHLYAIRVIDVINHHKDVSGSQRFSLSFSASHITSRYLFFSSPFSCNYHHFPQEQAPLLPPPSFVVLVVESIIYTSICMSRRISFLFVFTTFIRNHKCLFLFPQHIIIIISTFCNQMIIVLLFILLFFSFSFLVSFS